MKITWAYQFNMFSVYLYDFTQATNFNFPRVIYKKENKLTLMVRTCWLFQKQI